MDEQEKAGDESSLESAALDEVQVNTPDPVATITNEPGDSATKFKRPLFGLGRPVLIILIILMLLMIGSGLGAWIMHKSIKTTKTVVINTQTLDNGTLNKVTSSLGASGQVKQQLTISPNTLFKSNVTVQGSSAVDGDFSVSGKTHLQGPVTTGSNLGVGGNLTVSGQITAASLSVGSITLSALTLSGNLSVGGHIITTGVTPSITASVSAAGGTAAIAGNDTSGTITITTGKGSPLAGEMAIITFVRPFSLAPRIMLTPLNADAAQVQAYVTEHATFFTVRSAQTPAQSTIYSFNYLVVQ